MGEKAPTAQKHFVVILGGATQFHLGGKPALALQQPSLQLGSHLGMGVFFQLVQHDVTGVFKQIHGTPFLGTLVPQPAKFGLGVDTMNELVRMKWARFIQEVVQVRLHLTLSLTVWGGGGGSSARGRAFRAITSSLVGGLSGLHV